MTTPIAAAPALPFQPCGRLAPHLLGVRKPNPCCAPVLAALVGASAIAVGFVQPETAHDKFEQRLPGGRPW